MACLCGLVGPLDDSLIQISASLAELVNLAFYFMLCTSLGCFLQAALRSCCLYGEYPKLTLNSHRFQRMVGFRPTMQSRRIIT